ncbi:RNA recognition motif 1 in RNA-binding protein 28 (RBM28)-like protein [Rhizoctonia solani AG-3 Rhs1AP]|uniref:RNA recognition motif 1 in RNA-binding protein 28 (RBM28)-like protein n=1 Tax=Rhizoctonia solani AG-3 Rhs1AP TaxID=1086054 RepID=X8JHT3_9AGAM|nr:RNA recognition motif 1 in RNA-binding protein 28 (RBM28)-like protein [Rhizoctonia solani AG-3 Rhs1AP]
MWPYVFSHVLAPSTLFSRIKWSQRDSTLHKTGQGSIFVKNLDEAIDNRALHDIFAGFGNILSYKVAIDESGKSRGYAYVDYETAESAEAAIKAVNRTLLNGKQLFVGYHISRKERQSQVDESQFTNIYIKNLDAGITEAELGAMFEKFGTITSAVLQTDSEGKSRGFGFVNYEKHEEAERAVNEMNDKNIKGRILFVGRAQTKAERQSEFVRSHEAAKQERQNKYAGVNLYIKNLDNDVDEDQLRTEFEAFGTITSCKIMRGERNVSKGVGFVCFSTPDEATNAMTEMNNKIIGSKPLHVSLAVRRDVHRQEPEGQIMQRNQIHMQQAPMMRPGYTPPHALYPSGQAMPGMPVPSPYAGSVSPRGYSPQSYGRGTPPNALPRVSRSNETGIPLPPVNVGPRSTSGYPYGKNLNDDNNKAHTNRMPSPVGESTNNQNAPPDFTSDSSMTFMHPKDSRYYQPDRSGVFLVDGVLFKVQATAIFGSRPKPAVDSNREFTMMYLEDILPRLSGSSDVHPIELPGITRTQFQTYLLLITGLPYDEEYLSLLMDYLTPDKYNPDLFLRYFDILAVAPRLGMTKLEEWAINALHTIFTKSTHSFCQNHYNWRYDDLLQLRDWHENDTDSPMRAFIQY